MSDFIVLDLLSSILCSLAKCFVWKKVSKSDLFNVSSCMQDIGSIHVAFSLYLMFVGLPQMTALVRFICVLVFNILFRI